ncbi:MAG: YihA family ribosome biogenesis GTP-binding protein [Burkholderiales bacterium]|nr:YihA family ribosome biogenesis GTP-binding protein [Burkholderiales bacterium]
MSSLPASPPLAGPPKPLANPFRPATFFVSVNELSDLPDTAGGEVAFVGRSNAGKSSAINTLATRNQLAFVSKTPGRTQQINYFSLPEDRFLVDLPGYGFATAPQSVKQHWQELISAYLLSRAQLRALVLIMDARHPLKELDRQLIDWFVPAQKPMHVLLTKADKLSRQERIATLRRVNEELGKLPLQSSAQLFSSLSREGLDEAIIAIARLLGLTGFALAEIKSPG